MDFFGDEVDSIRRFEISSQLSSDKLDHIEILPDLTAAASPSERVSLARFAGEEATFWFFDADFVLRRINDLRRKVVADLDDPKRIDSLLTSRNGLLSDIGGRPMPRCSSRRRRSPPSTRTSPCWPTT